MNGIVDRLHRQGVVLEMRIAKEVGRCTGSQDKVVVVHRAEGCFDGFFLLVDGQNFAHAEEKVFAALENAAKGERHVAGLDARRGDLIDEGWKLVVVVFVD